MERMARGAITTASNGKPFDGQKGAFENGVYQKNS